MPGKNGLAKKIVAYVAANPGKTARQIGEALGFKHGSGMLGYMSKTGMIHGSGPIHWTCFYPTADEAAANHDRIAQAAIATRDAKALRARLDSEVYRMQRRHAAADKRRAEREATKWRIAKAKEVLGADAKRVLIPPHVKVTIAPTPPPRFAPAPGFVGVISSDYVMRRQGVPGGWAASERRHEGMSA